MIARLLVGIIGVRVDRAWAKASHLPVVQKHFAHSDAFVFFGCDWEDSFKKDLPSAAGPWLKRGQLPSQWPSPWHPELETLAVELDLPIKACAEIEKRLREIIRELGRIAAG